MSLETRASTTPPIEYPESDGLPMSDNTRQFRWITMLAGNLDALFADDPNVFVGGNLLWYPVEGHPEIRYAPDAFVVFGRPKGERGSYRQWEENDVPMTVAFEVLSPNNTTEEMIEKHLAYEEYGVREYYLFDPDSNTLQAYQRGKAALVQVRFQDTFVSPLLGIRFDLTGEEMAVYYPNGEPFITLTQLQQIRREAVHRADNEQQRADNEQQRADKEQQRADKAEERARRLSELALKVVSGTASAAELEELQTLSQQSS